MTKTEIPRTQVRNWCPSQSKDGLKCSLYLDHLGLHKSQHLKKEWKDEDGE